MLLTEQELMQETTHMFDIMSFNPSTDEALEAVKIYRANMTTLRTLGIVPVWDEQGGLSGWRRGDTMFNWRGQQLYTLEHSTKVLVNVHSPDACAGEHCTIHNRSNHSMRAFPQHWRADRGIMERICPHGVGHPDPDSPWPNNSHEWIHGCDGCCTPEGFFDARPAGSVWP